MERFDGGGSTGIGTGDDAVEIYGIRVKNYLAIKDLTIGCMDDGAEAKPLSRLSVLVGPDVLGKDDVFGAIGFAVYCITHSIESFLLRGGIVGRCLKQGMLKNGSVFEISISAKDYGGARETYTIRIGCGLSVRGRFEVCAGGDARGFFSKIVSHGTVDQGVTAAIRGRSLFCISQPEVGLHFRMITAMMSQLRVSSRDGGGRSNILLTSCSPVLVGHMRPDEVWVLLNGKARRTSEIAGVSNRHEKGEALGRVWLTGGFGD